MNAIDPNTISTEEFFSGPAEGQIRFAVVDHTGDTKYIWDKTKEVEVNVARSLFEELTGSGYSAFRLTGKDDKSGEMVKTFDPTHERLLFTPRIVGG